MRLLRAGQRSTPPLNCGVRRSEDIMVGRAGLTVRLLFLFCAPCVGLAQEQTDSSALVRTFQESLPPDAVTNVKAIEANGFRIRTSRNKEFGESLKSTGNEFNSLFIDSDGTFSVGIENGRPMSTGGGLAIFHKDSGEPMLSVGDSDGDGKLDGLTYTVVEAKGEAVLSVTDYDVDGQPDVRLRRKDQFAEIWHKGQWYRIEKRGQLRGIVVDGDFKNLQREGNRLVVPD